MFLGEILSDVGSLPSPGWLCAILALSSLFCLFLAPEHTGVAEPPAVPCSLPRVCFQQLAVMENHSLPFSILLPGARGATL